MTTEISKRMLITKSVTTDTRDILKAGMKITMFSADFSNDEARFEFDDDPHTYYYARLSTLIENSEPIR